MFRDFGCMEQLDPTVLAEREGGILRKKKDVETVSCVTAKRRRTIMLSHLSFTVPRDVRSAQRSTWIGEGEGGAAWKNEK